jgi:hypothetical protein
LNLKYALYKDNEYQKALRNVVKPFIEDSMLNVVFNQLCCRFKKAANTLQETIRNYVKFKAFKTKILKNIFINEMLELIAEFKDTKGKSS